jgi:NTP pyrophosphatase (non-canonical NTP hydrolase)
MNNTIAELQNACHKASVEAGWYTDLKTGKPLQPSMEVKGLKIALIHSEVSEALEGERKDLMDDHLPNRKMAEVEMADAVIRILDYCGFMGYDLEGAILAKIDYNKHRADHKIENRLQKGGKQF